MRLRKTEHETAIEILRETRNSLYEEYIHGNEMTYCEYNNLSNQLIKLENYHEEKIQNV